MQWAQSYSHELVKGITDTTQKIINDALTNFFEQSMTRADLEKMISDAFGPVRTEMIAVTEVTRAATEAEIEVGEELADEGILMIAIWKTRNDELVCPICGPLNEKPADGYTGKRRPYWGNVGAPPAHPRCRCSIGWELPKR